jgi:hypothetical protein
MDIERFWKIIESSRHGMEPDSADGNMERQLDVLRRHLLELPPGEIVAFRDHLLECMHAAFQWDLWGAAYIIGDGCSDDGFTDFRGWLISMGKGIFERALADAESLVDVADAPGVEDVFFEEFLNVPAHAYEEVTGRDIPEYTGHFPSEPAGKRWSEEGGELKRRFPRLWKKYGARR